MMNRRVFLGSIAALAFVAHPGTGLGAKQDTGGKAMLEKVVYLTVFVKSQDKALDFYTRLLEFEKRVDNRTPDGGPRFLTVGVRGEDFQLVLWPGKPVEQSGDGGLFRGNRIAIARGPNLWLRARSGLKAKWYCKGRLYLPA